MGRFLSFLFTGDTDRISRWAIENAAALKRTGCGDPDPLKAAMKFADHCIRTGVDDEVDPDYPVGYYSVNGGLWCQAEIKGTATSDSEHINLSGCRYGRNHAGDADAYVYEAIRQYRAMNKTNNRQE